MTFTIIGKIVTTKQVFIGKGNDGREWEKQEYVIENNDGERIAFYVFGKESIEKYGLANGVRAAVTLELKQSEWNDRYMTSLQCVACLCNKNTQSLPSNMGIGNNGHVDGMEQFARRVETKPSYVQREEVNDGGSVNAKDLPF